MCNEVKNFKKCASRIHRARGAGGCSFGSVRCDVPRYAPHGVRGAQCGSTARQSEYFEKLHGVAYNSSGEPGAH
jgi:hypothetical protein